MNPVFWWGLVLLTPIWGFLLAWLGETIWNNPKAFKKVLPTKKFLVSAAEIFIFAALVVSLVCGVIMMGIGLVYTFDGK